MYPVEEQISNPDNLAQELTDITTKINDFIEKISTLDFSNGGFSRWTSGENMAGRRSNICMGRHDGMKRPSLTHYVSHITPTQCFTHSGLSVCCWMKKRIINVMHTLQPPIHQSVTPFWFLSNSISNFISTRKLPQTTFAHNFTSSPPSPVIINMCNSHVAFNYKAFCIFDVYVQMPHGLPKNSVHKKQYDWVEEAPVWDQIDLYLNYNLPLLFTICITWGQ